MNGEWEEKGHQIRIIYRQMNRNTYVLFAIFVKKVDNDKGYRSFLTNRLDEFKKVEDFIKNNLENEEFIAENNFNLQQLYNIIRPLEVEKKHIKGE